MEIFTNSVDPDEMPLNLAAHQALTCLICHISTENQLCRMLLVHSLYDDGLLNINLSILEIFTNNVDPDEMPLNVASHQNLVCLLIKQNYFRRKTTFSERYYCYFKYIEDIQIFGMNMSFISSSGAKNAYFMSGEATNEIYIFSLHEMK